MYHHMLNYHHNLLVQLQKYILLLHQNYMLLRPNTKSNCHRNYNLSNPNSNLFLNFHKYRRTEQLHHHNLLHQIVCNAWCLWALKPRMSHKGHTFCVVLVFIIVLVSIQYSIVWSSIVYHSILRYVILLVWYSIIIIDPFYLFKRSASAFRRA